MLEEILGRTKIVREDRSLSIHVDLYGCYLREKGQLQSRRSVNASSIPLVDDMELRLSHSGRDVATDLSSYPCKDAGLCVGVCLCHAKDSSCSSPDSVSAVDAGAGSLCVL